MRLVQKITLFLFWSSAFAEFIFTFGLQRKCQLIPAHLSLYLRCQRIQGASVNLLKKCVTPPNQNCHPGGNFQLDALYMLNILSLVKICPFITKISSQNNPGKNFQLDPCSYYYITIIFHLLSQSRQARIYQN